MHEQSYDDTRINTELTEKTYDKLAVGLDFRFGEDAGIDPKYLKMQQNLYKFSAAKTTVQLTELNNALYNADGSMKSWEDFQKSVDELHVKYNKNWLQAEWQTTRQAGHHARNWETYQEQKHLFPNLKYRTVGDDRVRKDHKELDGIIAPIDSPFWSKYYPPNGWRCFEPTTPILTENGWKAVRDISRGDYVVGGSGNMRFVGDVITSDFDGNLITILTKGELVSCTPNHRFLTRNGWVEAGSIQRSDIILQVAKPGFFNKFFNAIHNTIAIVQYGLMALKGKRETTSSLNVD